MHSRNILFEYNSSPSMIRDSDVCGLVTCLIFKFHLVNRASLIMLMCMQRPADFCSTHCGGKCRNH